VLSASETFGISPTSMVAPSSVGTSISYTLPIYNAVYFGLTGCVLAGRCSGNEAVGVAERHLIPSNVGRSKYPPAEPEALWVADPSKGSYRDPKSKPQAPGCIAECQHCQSEKHTAGNVKLLLPPRQSRGISQRISGESPLWRLFSALAPNPLIRLKRLTHKCMPF
jgi:hypothetical protein